MTRPTNGPDQNPAVLVGALVVIGGLLFTFFRFVIPQEDAPEMAVPRATIADQRVDAVPPEITTQPFQQGFVVRPELGPEGPELAPASNGRRGTGLRLRELPDLDLPVGPPVEGEVLMAVANIPQRSGVAGLSRSLRTLTQTGADFVVLNEVGGRPLSTIRSAAPGYGAYRDPVPDPGPGGNQSKHNVILWNTQRWTMIDAGRVKLVENDRGYHHRKPFVWDRYATWGAFQRADGAIVSVVGTHMMTNPAQFPRQHGNPPMSRRQQYAYGMDVLRGLVSRLEVHGAVLVGGDMNTFAHQGNWSAHARMRAHGYTYVRDRAVMYLFYPTAMRRISHRQVRVASDHPAILTHLDLNGVGPKS